MFHSIYFKNIYSYTFKGKPCIWKSKITFEHKYQLFKKLQTPTTPLFLKFKIKSYLKNKKRKINKRKEKLFSTELRKKKSKYV